MCGLKRLSAQSDGDLFIMPTLETSMAAASEGALRDGGVGGQTVDQGLGAMRDMDLDAALLECASARGKPTLHKCLAACKFPLVAGVLPGRT